MELTDGHVIVRNPNTDDAEHVVAAVQSSQPELHRWLPWATEDYGTKDALAWITLELDPYPFLITDRSGTIVGAVGLNQIDEANGVANLGYWLRSDATGHGYATAATRLMADYGLEEVGLQRIEIVMSVDNEPSRAVAERSGAVHEGTLRSRLRLHGKSHDAHVYSIIGHDR